MTSPPSSLPVFEVGFRLFSPLHGAVVAAFVILTFTAVLVGRRMQRRGQERGFAAALGLGGMVVWLVINGWWMSFDRFEGKSSLPLHVCDLAALIAPLALLTRARWLRALLYYWGIGLCTQAFITPLLRRGPDQIEFWLFWLNHFAVVGCAIYDLAVRGFRPAWRDWTLAMSATLVYLALVLPLNLIFDWNYGYVGRVRLRPGTLMDYLPDWPLRVALMALLVAIVFAVMTVPWLIFRRTGSPAASPSSAQHLDSREKSG